MAACLSTCCCVSTVYVPQPSQSLSQSDRHSNKLCCLFGTLNAPPHTSPICSPSFTNMISFCCYVILNMDLYVYVVYARYSHRCTFSAYLRLNGSCSPMTCNMDAQQIVTLLVAAYHPNVFHFIFNAVTNEI